MKLWRKRQRISKRREEMRERAECDLQVIIVFHPDHCYCIFPKNLSRMKPAPATDVREELMAS